MTPLQRKQLAQILLKEGEEDWRVENADLNGRHRDKWDVVRENHAVDTIGWRYRAVRIERVPTRTPLPIEHYKRGMEVLIDRDTNVWLVLRVANNGKHVKLLLGDDYTCHIKAANVTSWRWPNETEWHPAFTETVEEKIVETLIVEGL